jgi:N-acetylglucosaminyldiphosphoundecaprenol N-acetyl-beta-D-mannosaminyltransferase
MLSTPSPEGGRAHGGALDGGTYEVVGPSRPAGLLLASAGHPPVGLAPTPFVDLPSESASGRASEPANLPTVDIHGVRIHAITEEQTTRYILSQSLKGRGGWVITPNLDHLRRVSRDSDLRQLYSSATLMVADGMPLIWASRIQGTPLPERIAGSGLISTLSQGAAEAGRSIFLLGGDPGTAEEAAGILQRKYPNLRIAGTYFPKPGFEEDPAQMRELIRCVCEADPDIIYVGLGSPKQERLIERLHGYLPRAWWMGVGISFSFLAGAVQRAPSWVQRSGLEWVHRLMQEPRRLAKRYLVQGLPFAAELLGRAMIRRIRTRSMRGLVPQPQVRAA